MALKLQTYQLGSKRSRAEGLRVGVARRPPLGVHKENYARLDDHDVWFLLLAPSQALLSWIYAQEANDPMT